MDGTQRLRLALKVGLLEVGFMLVAFTLFFFSFLFFLADHPRPYPGPLENPRVIAALGLIISLAIDLPFLRLMAPRLERWNIGPTWRRALSVTNITYAVLMTVPLVLLVMRGD